MKPRLPGSIAPLTSLVSSGWLPLMLRVASSTRVFYRVAYLGAAAKSGLLRRLAEGPVPFETLAAELLAGPELEDGLRSWLAMGVQLGVVRQTPTGFGLGGRLAKALAAPANDPIAAFYEELNVLHHPLIMQTPERLRSGTLFTLEPEHARLVARTSRISEPILRPAIAGVIPVTGPVRLLEVGCGSGTHIRYATTLNPQLTAVGIELQAQAAAAAEENIATWGLTDAVRIETGDVRDRTGAGDFDVVTLHQNIYYFPETEWVGLLRHLATFLRPGGRLLVTTICRDGGVTIAGLDLWGAMTEGCSRMPIPAMVAERMRQAGLTEVSTTRLSADGLYYSFVGTRS